MPKFGKLSESRLNECHEDLQTIFNEVIKYVDISIVCGYRNEKDQNDAYFNGFSKVKYPNSKHNTKPSIAADVVPYPELWSDTDKLRRLVGYVIATAQQLYNQGKISHLVINGSDWDNDFDEKDHTFIDLPHYQLYKP